MGASLAKAVLNPTRIRILDALANGAAEPQQLARTLDDDSRTISYHVAVLSATGCVQPVDAERPREESSYELTQQASAFRRLTRRLPVPDMQRGSSANQLSYGSIVVDRQGWEEVSAALAEAVERVSTAHRESAERLDDTPGESISATVAVAGFELPPAA